MQLGLDSNHDAEDLIRATLAPDVAARLEFDSEAGAFSVFGDPGDIALVRAAIAALAQAT